MPSRRGQEQFYFVSIRGSLRQNAESLHQTISQFYGQFVT